MTSYFQEYFVLVWGFGVQKTSVDIIMNLSLSTSRVGLETGPPSLRLGVNPVLFRLLRMGPWVLEKSWVKVCLKWLGDTRGMGRE